MAEADPRDRDRDRLGMPERWGSGKLLWSLSKHDLHYSQVACGVILTYRATTYSLTHLPLTAYRCPPLYSPLTTRYLVLSTSGSVLQTKVLPTFERSPWKCTLLPLSTCHLLPPTASCCLVVPQLLLMHYTVVALVEFCSRSVHINRFQLSNT